LSRYVSRNTDKIFVINNQRPLLTTANRLLAIYQQSKCN